MAGYVRDLVARLAHDQMYRCYWCRKQVEPLTFDHIVGAANGGTYTIENGVAACSPCNQDRGKTPFEEYKRKRHGK